MVVPICERGDRMFIYYEEGRKKVFSMRKLFRIFNNQVGEEQKIQGTDFLSWLSEMEKMQILIRMEAK